jgi:CheY-like chemotaxis protein
MSTVTSDPFRNGVAAAQAGDFDRAAALLGEAARRSPDDPRVWLWRAASAPSAEVAQGFLRRALEIDAKQEAARVALGRLLLAQSAGLAASDRAAARDLLLEACQLVPQNGRVWLALAGVTDDDAERLMHLRRAIQILPESQEAKGRLRDDLVRQAVAAAKQGGRDAAVTLLREAATVAPSDLQVWLALGHLSKPAHAIVALRFALTLAPGHAVATANLKKTLVAEATFLAEQDREGALALIREAVALDPVWEEGWLALAAMAAEPEAAAAVDRVLQINPLNEKAAALKRPVQPVSPAPAPHTQMPAAVAEQSAAPARTILIVDDSPTVRKALGMILEREGHHVLAEPDGEQALARLDTDLPDLVFLDINMPRMDGYEVCRRIRKHARAANVPVVMLSGKDGFFDKVRGRVAGATEYITKPFEPPTVLAAIAVHCKQPVTN